MSSLRALDRFELQRLPIPRAWARHRALLAVLASVVISSGLMFCFGADVARSGSVFLNQVLFSPNGWTETLVILVPLGLTGLGVTIARKAGFWNIGGEGQLLMGALFGVFLASGLQNTSVSGALATPLLLAAAFLGGALLALVAVLAKAFRGADEVIVTLLLNFIALYLVSYLVTGPLRDADTMWVQTPALDERFRFARIPGMGRLSTAIFLLATVVLPILYLELRTHWNTLFEVTASNGRALASSGRRPTVVLVLAASISGGICGLAGWVEVAGTQYRLIQDLSPGYGYYAVVVAVASAGRCLRAMWIALLIAILLNGIDSATRVAGVPVYVGEVVLGLTLVSYATIDKLSNHRIQIRGVDVGWISYWHRSAWPSPSYWRRMENSSPSGPGS